MLISSIDIGSNTILLLIAEYDAESNSVKSILNKYRIPRISHNLGYNLIISNEKIVEMWSVLEEYDSLINQLGIKIKLAVATNAFRTARNGEELADKIKNTFNWDIKILDGYEEARLSFLGSLPNDHSNNNFIIVDIGGGSTEIIYGSSEKIYFKKSINVGVVNLFEKYILHNPPTLNEIHSIEKELDKEFNLLQQFEFNFRDIIAVAGTPTTVSCMLQGQKTYNEKIVDNSLITKDGIKSIIAKLSRMTAVQIVNDFGEVVIGREEVLLPGSIILLKILEALKRNSIKVSIRGLRYGVIINYLNSAGMLNKDLKIL